MKHDLTTGTWQDDTGCPISISIILAATSDEGDLGWNWFGVGILDPNVFNDRINQGALCKLVGAISKLLDVDSHVICWMVLILDVESQSLNLFDRMLKLGVIVTQENTVVNVYHEDDVPTEEYTDNTQSSINEAV